MSIPIPATSLLNFVVTPMFNTEIIFPLEQHQALISLFDLFISSVASSMRTKYSVATRYISYTLDTVLLKLRKRLLCVLCIFYVGYFVELLSATQVLYSMSKYSSFCMLPKWKVH
jgi:hypothetical protein